MGYKKTLLDAVRLNPERSAGLGTFSIPQEKQKRFEAVTLVHYINSCNELAQFLMGTLSYFENPKVSRYLPFTEYEKIYDKNKFRAGKLLDFQIAEAHLPNDSYQIRMELLKMKKLNGTVVALMQVYGATEGRLIYTYTPNGAAL